jgi:hypothetical protein
MEAPPAQPADVRAEANADQTVRVTWARNSEPDMIAYRVQRKDPGAASFHDIGGAVPQPSGGSAVSIADPAAAPGGGTFDYQVQAIRAGRSGDASTPIGSGFSSTSVAVAPIGPGATNSPAPAPPAENPALTPNLSAFLKGSAGGLPKASLPQAPAIPDGGFSENLPFAAPASRSGRGEEAIGLGAESSGNGARAILIPVAGGLLLCLVAFHVRRLNGWLAPAAAKPVSVTPIPSAPLAHDEPSPPPPAAARAGITILDDAPNGTTKTSSSPESAFASWLTGNGPLPDPVDDAVRDNKPEDEVDDDRQWAPLGASTSSPKASGAPQGDDDWDNILVKPGGGRTPRSQ